MSEKILPRTIDEVDSVWLSEVLAADVEVVGVEGVGSPMTSQLHRVILRSPEGLPDSVIVKLALDGPIRAFLDGVGAYTRELTFYEGLAPSVPVRVPHPYAVRTASSSTDFALVIEDLAPLTSPDSLSGLDPSQAHSAVGALARFHAYSWEHPRLADLSDRFPAIDSERGVAILTLEAGLFAQGWPLAKQYLGAELTTEVRHLGDHYAELVPAFVEELRTPKTIIHGELKSDNLFFSEHDEPILVDFQTVREAPGPIEIAYLLSQSMTTPARREIEQELVRRYYTELHDAGVDGYTWEQCWRQYTVGAAMYFSYPVMGFMQFEQTNERGRSLLVEMVRRAAAAVNDHAVVGQLSG
ncbi:MAG: phosphotransferase [Solirubrobacteraceae bacterium]